jgi:3'(2'), 5'-bisphosphate nucleotidase
MTDMDAELARHLATAAGELLLDLRATLGFDDTAKLRAEGDRRSHEYLMAQLAAWRPGDAVLSEEALGARAADEAAERLSADRIWIVDPLDGTREYAEAGRTDWAVHVALWTTAAAPAASRRRRRTSAAPRNEKGRLAAGAIALPAQGSVLATDRAPQSPPEQTAHGAQVRIAVSRSRPPEFVARVAAELGAVPVPMGSAGAKIAAVISGEVDAYLHAGGQYEWDSAAPVAVALAQGLHASRLDGSPLIYNQADPRLPDLLVCRPRLARPLLEAVERELLTASHPGMALGG